MYKDYNQKIVATIEARMTSSRLPGKVLLPLAGKPALERLIERLKRSKYLDEIVVATTINKPDDRLVDLAQHLKVKYFRGSENDVLSRVLGAAQSVDAQIIVEITGDCPLMDWRLVDRGIEEYFFRNIDYVTNCLKTTYPLGFEVQIFSVKTLAKVEKITQDPIDRTHVSCYIYNHPEKYKIYNWEAEEASNLPKARLTLDEKDDYSLINKVYESLLPQDQDFSVQDVVTFLKANPNLLEINQYVKQKSLKEG